MKVKCLLVSRDLPCTVVTSCDIEPDHGVFLAASDNPFPASELVTVVVSNSAVTASYRVKEAA